MAVLSFNVRSFAKLDSLVHTLELAGIGLTAIKWSKRITGYAPADTLDSLPFQAKRDVCLPVSAQLRLDG